MTVLYFAFYLVSLMQSSLMLYFLYVNHMLQKAGYAEDVEWNDKDGIVLADHIVDRT